MFLRLHHCFIVHNSPFERNILVQPGPLSCPPSLRSRVKASFRLIDFGRSRDYSSRLRQLKKGNSTETERQEMEREVLEACKKERETARDELELKGKDVAHLPAIPTALESMRVWLFEQLEFEQRIERL